MPNPTMITCPQCSSEIALSDVLAEQFRHENETRLAALAQQAEARAQADFATERQFLEAQITDERNKRQAAQQAELQLRQQQPALDERARELDLEVARRVAAEKATLEQSIRRGLAEAKDLKLQEKDKLIADLHRDLDAAQRRAQQGSQQNQGEVLELDVEAELGRRFPHDRIAPVPKGRRGADLIQEVCDAARGSCGRIVWETKNTRSWQAGWVAKLKNDQRAINADLAVIVTAVLPQGIAEFGCVDGIWVASLRAWPALALVLREQVIQVAFAHAAVDSKAEKMEKLYDYLAGNQFRGRIEAIVEAFTALKGELDRERAAMARIWAEREKRIESAVANAARLHGEMRGIIGTSLSTVPALELDAAAGLLPPLHPMPAPTPPSRPRRAHSSG
jgi:hypothetical protein